MQETGCAAIAQWNDDWLGIKRGGVASLQVTSARCARRRNEDLPVLLGMQKHHLRFLARERPTCDDADHYSTDLQKGLSLI